MKWPLPTSWERSAEAVVIAAARKARREKLKKNKSRSTKKKVLDRDPLFEFKHHTVREKFYQIVGHHYAISLCRASYPDLTDMVFQLDRFIDDLGINDSQLGRWTTEKTFIEADRFFAFQLLFLDKEIKELHLPPNREVTLQSLISIFHYLAKTYDKAVFVRLDEGKLSLLLTVMKLMAENPDAVFNPHDTTRANPRPLAQLLAPTCAGESPQLYEQRIRRVEDTIRSVLTAWGMAYSLYAIGRRTTGMIMEQQNETHKSRNTGRRRKRHGPRHDPQLAVRRPTPGYQT